MNLDEARILAEQEIIKHKLHFWEFKFNNRKKSLGLCSYRHKIIYLSRDFVLLNTQEEIMNTIRHEIAHALLPSNEGHGDNWKRKALEIGCNAQRVNSTAILKEGKYIFICPKCGDRTPAYRKPKRDRACFKCCTTFNNGRYKEEYKLILEERK